MGVLLELVSCVSLFILRTADCVCGDAGCFFLNGGGGGGGGLVGMRAPVTGERAGTVGEE